jgi:hypothetical protein
MSDTNTGGPAFPLFAATGYAGMTMRDYFAAKAMQGIFASGNLPDSVSDEEIAAAVYKTADAMLKARDA